MFEPLPDYMNNWKYSKEVDMKKKLKSFKKFGYDRQFEEHQLNKIEKELGLRSGDHIAKRLSSFGIRNLKTIQPWEEIQDLERKQN